MNLIIVDPHVVLFDFTNITNFFGKLQFNSLQLHLRLIFRICIEFLFSVNLNLDRSLILIFESPLRFNHPALIFLYHSFSQFLLGLVVKSVSMMIIDGELNISINKKVLEEGRGKYMHDYCRPNQVNKIIDAEVRWRQGQHVNEWKQ